MSDYQHGKFSHLMIGTPLSQPMVYFIRQSRVSNYQVLNLLASNTSSGMRCLKRSSEFHDTLPRSFSHQYVLCAVSALPQGFDLFAYCDDDYVQRDSWSNKIE